MWERYKGHTHRTFQNAEYLNVNSRWLIRLLLGFKHLMKDIGLTWGYNTSVVVHRKVCWSVAVRLFRRVRPLAKSVCSLRHVRFSFCPSQCISTAHTGRISVKFGTAHFYENQLGFCYDRGENIVQFTWWSWYVLLLSVSLCFYKNVLFLWDSMSC
jgi:hypothetical protein